MLLLLLISAVPATAEKGLGFSLGLMEYDNDLVAIEAGIDYRFDEIPLGFVPNLGLQVTSDEAFYVFVGLRRPVRLGSSLWEVVPSFAVSFYEQRDGQDLGHRVQFRSGLDVVRRFESGRAFGFGFYHLSNSSLSLTNPGTNSLLFRIKLP